MISLFGLSFLLFVLRLSSGTKFLKVCHITLRKGKLSNFYLKSLRKIVLETWRDCLLRNSFKGQKVKMTLIRP